MIWTSNTAIVMRMRMVTIRKRVKQIMEISSMAKMVSLMLTWVVRMTKSQRKGWMTPMR